MSLQRLDIYNVRNIRKQTLIPAPGFNFIYGQNGSGKSALIEAIYLLGRAKSFRSSSVKSIISFDHSHLTLFAEVLNENQYLKQLGIQMDGKNIDIHINHQPNQKRSQLAYSLPLQLIQPKSFELLDSGSQLRREFLDWGVFNNEPKFLESWRKYKKALLHRNALLKLKTINQINVWNQELVFYGTMVDDYRNQYLNALRPVLIQAISKFLIIKGFDIKLMPGWAGNTCFELQLTNDLEKDLRYGYTNSGPHRADFLVSIDNRPAKDVMSRGQLKLLVIALKLAQVELMIKRRNYFGCILFDDFSAELDFDNRKKILDYLTTFKTQVFITAAERRDFGDLDRLESYKMFHVERGELQPVDVPHGTI